jgi:hypothetical protein
VQGTSTRGLAGLTGIHSARRSAKENLLCPLHLP